MERDRTYLFYELMNYPCPKQKEFFAYGQELPHEREIQTGYSWETACPVLEEFREVITRHERLWKSLPFIESIYICNSMSFNALKDDSDIDLFFVVKNGRMRTARFRSTVMLLVLGIKRIGKWIRKKFCLSFYVTTSHIDLQPIRLNPYDPYLVYWLAHLVPLYHERMDDPTDIYEANFWLRSYLPNFPMEQVIDV
ncbi:MAG: hypothetical protein H6765_08390 [Candidatus Peribacteria bacterium]|nr:MAG: hypothetical protein H6765_08390 [Candidatus Peribacteria bacterium]